MENASKALLIAGSVLIAILLIAFGVRTFNSTQGTTESVKETMSATEMATFNNKFSGYMGTNVPAAKVKALANLIIANNATADSNHTVKLKVGASEATDVAATIQSNVNALTGHYTVNATTVENGLVKIITVS